MKEEPITKRETINKTQIVMTNGKKRTIKNFEEKLFEALGNQGYVLPESDEEIRQYLISIGETKLEMPESLSDPDAIYYNAMNSLHENVVGMAAYEHKEGIDLPQSLLDKLDEDAKRGNIIKNEKGAKEKKH